MKAYFARNWRLIAVPVIIAPTVIAPVVALESGAPEAGFQYPA